MKLIENCSLQELKNILQNDIPYDIVEIVYDYMHRNKYYSVHYFSKSKHISTATLYRYIDKVNIAYKRH